MKKSRISVCIVSIIMCTGLLTQADCLAQNAVSKAEIEFIAGIGPTYPVHPEDPNVSGNEDGVTGSLAIVSVSDFDFGSIPVSNATEEYETITDMPNIQVVDLRGTAVGWKVTAQVSRFKSGTVDTLPGAVIHITDGRPNSISVSEEPEQVENVELTADGEPIKVLSAAEGAGTGLWVMRWYPDIVPDGEPPGGAEEEYVKLEIPAGTATLGSHKATINWVLGNVPQ